MKLSGQIKGSGKLGNIVAVQTGGECIAREYKATVANPSTPAQVNQRAILKLMSQVAASVAPVLAIPKQGLKSSRNLFISKNYGLASANDGAAQLTIENLQLTLSNTGLPAIEAERIAGSKISVKLASAANLVADRIVYILFSKSVSNTLTYEQSIVVSAPGADNLFPGELDDVSGDAVLYAYGMKDASASAHASYGNYAVSTGEDVARLIMQRKLSTADYSLTQTRGCEIFAGETGGNTPAAGQVAIYATASGPGNVTGAGNYQVGASVILTAEPNEGAIFIGWRNNGSNQFIAYTPYYIFIAEAQRDLVAVFNNPQSPTGGEPGAPSVNPLPYSYAEVKIDGQSVDITSGRVQLNTTFDSIGISNVGEGEHFTYVPEGHILGDSACIGLAPEGIPNEDYGFEVTGCGTGAIYLDSNVFFYIIVNETPAQQVTINASADPALGGSVTGAGTYNIASQVSLVASPNTDYHFEGWYENGSLVSTNANLTFAANANRTLVAVFEEDTPSDALMLVVNRDENPTTLGEITGDNFYVSPSLYPLRGIAFRGESLSDVSLKIDTDESGESEHAQDMMYQDGEYFVSTYYYDDIIYVFKNGEMWFQIIKDE